MSKKRKIDKQKRNNQTSYLYELSSDRKGKIRREVLFFSIVSLVLIITVFNKYFNSPDVPFWFSLFWKITLPVLLGVRAGGNQVILKSLDRHKDVQALLKFQRWMRHLSILIISLIVFPAIYYSPIREQLSIFLLSIRVFAIDFVNKIWGFFSVVLATISGYFGNIILGALGNLFYDFLKSVYSKVKVYNKGIYRNKK